MLELVVALTVRPAADRVRATFGVSDLWARAVPRTVQVVTDGIVRYLIGVWVRVHILVELNVACDGVPENAQPAGLPTCDREVAPDCADGFLFFSCLSDRSTLWGN